MSARRDAGGGLLLIGLDVKSDSAVRYTSPGQYVEVVFNVSADGRKKGYFVLAGDVGAHTWELLVRNAGDAADALATLPLGSPVDVSTPLGLGFPIERARGRHLAVAVAGSAMAVARPVMRQRFADGDGKATSVFVGVRASTDIPLAAELEGWIEGGARVVLCLSRPAGLDDAAVIPRATRAAGYVQGAVELAIASGQLGAGSLVVAAGPEKMLTDMKNLPAARSGAVEVITNV